jgi:hypothetical protein
MYEIQIPLKISSPLPIFNLSGGFCNRELVNLNINLNITNDEKININNDI